MKQGEKKQPDQREGIRVNMLGRLGGFLTALGWAAFKQLQNVIPHFEQGQGTSKRQDRIQRQHAAQMRAEGGGAEALEPAQVDFAAMINPVEVRRQLTVGANQRISEDERPQSVNDPCHVAAVFLACAAGWYG